MAKYIDADRLKADLDKWVETMAGAEGDYSDGVRFAIQHFIFLLASLQQEQPDVDLEVRKRIEELANDWHHKGFASDEDCPLCMQDLMDILWHFYELGKNSK